MRRPAFLTTLGGILMLLGAANFAVAAEPAGESDQTSPPISTKIRGRLPSHYAEVVNEEQRARIYQIQAEYRDRIESLEDQLKALKQQRDEKIKSVLTEEQKQTIAKAVAEAKARRSAKGWGKTPTERPDR